MAWYNPFTWADDGTDDSSEGRAKSAGDKLYDGSSNLAPGAPIYVPQNPNVAQYKAPYGYHAPTDGQGNTMLQADYSPVPWLVANEGTDWEKYTSLDTHEDGKVAFDPKFEDDRSYMYGRTPGGADAAVNKAYGTGDAAAAYGQQAASRAVANGQTAMGREAQYGDWGKQNTSLHRAGLGAEALGALESQQGPSAAQAQLQAGTNQALGSQVALARSGRGFGGGAAASGLAASNMAGIQANQANAAATLRAQEDAAWRSRQAANLGASSGLQASIGQQYGQQAQADVNSFYQNRQQNDAAGLAWNGLANDTYLKGAGVDLAAQGQASGIRGQEMQGGMALEDAKMRAWAAQNGYDLTQQQMDSQESAAQMAAGATVLSGLLSDIRAKKNIRPAGGAGAQLARSIVRPGGGVDAPTVTAEPEAPPDNSYGSLDFDGTIFRPREEAPAMTQMQQEHLGGDEPAQFSDTFTRPELKAPDTDALDAASLDAVRNSPASFYDYKDPSTPGANDRRNYGPMAQDLAKTPAGATAVVEQPNGKLGVDTNRLSLVNTGALAEQQRQLDAITAELEAFKRRPGADYPEYER